MTPPGLSGGNMTPPGLSGGNMTPPGLFSSGNYKAIPSTTLLTLLFLPRFLNCFSLNIA